MRIRPRKRTLLMVLLLLTGGTIINVAVAWGCEVRTLAWAEAYECDGVDIMRRSGSLFLEATVPYRSYVHGKLIDRDEFEKMLPAGSVFQTYSPAPMELQTSSFILWREHSAGWPVLSTRSLGRREMDPGWKGPGWSVYGSYSILGDKVQLPLLPLWPGFAINTVFYAAVLWLLFAALHPGGFVRRRIRARRGQCPACGYPVGTSEVCTECGKPVPKGTI